MAYSPILKGAYADPAKQRDHGIMDTYRGADSDARLAAVQKVAADLGVTGNQLVLAWLLHQDDPRRVGLIGPRTVDQYAELIQAVDLKLDADTLARLDQAGA